MVKVGCAAVVLIAITGTVDHALFWREERTSLRASTAARDRVEPGKRVEVLFLGDSITSGFPLSTYLPRWIAPINAGVPGETTDQIRARWETYDPASYDYVVLSGGTNDIRRSIDQKVPHRVVENLLAMQTPNAIILEIPEETRAFAFPWLAFGPYGSSVAAINEEIRRTNERLPAVVFALNGRHYRAADGYHLNFRAYREMAKRIADEILARETVISSQAWTNPN